jgi:hypothetical protein
MPELLAGLTYPFRGVAYFAGRPALWKYAAAAMAIHLAAFIAVLILYLELRHGIVEGMTPARFPGWLHTASGWILSVGLAVAALFAAWLAGNLLSLPVLDALTARILRDLGESLPEGRGFRHAVWRSLVNLVM